jgi:hypothetical protein
LKQRIFGKFPNTGILVTCGSKCDEPDGIASLAPSSTKQWLYALPPGRIVTGWGLNSD